ncbi:MAG: ankyrin repeat domain-containing protein [Candidatus Endonucleobacter sp. (ex Gigantidas childressi)]|nr:ankyrin repeat domain-containing protein [Candidatus Endonucleobacter sp. (ex Gigantidas childressi)]
MRSALLVMMFFAFVVLFPMQRVMATLDAVNQDMPMNWIPANNNIVKIIVPITLHSDSSTDAVVNLSGVDVSSDMITEMFSFVYGSDEIQNTALSKNIDAINKDSKCPVTVSQIKKDGFDFVVIKQLKKWLFEIFDIKVQRVADFTSVEKKLSLEKIFSFIPIEEKRVDEQVQDGVLDIKQLSRDLLEADSLLLAENSIYSFVLYIPCSVKDATDCDDSSPSYAAFLFRNDVVELQEELCKLNILDNSEEDVEKGNSVCSSCKVKCFDPRTTVITKCNHIYHESCIDVLFEEKESNKMMLCPFCKGVALPLQCIITKNSSGGKQEAASKDESNNDSKQVYFKDDPRSACNEGNLELLKELHAQNSTICNHRFLSYTNGERSPLLFFATQHNHVNIAEFLISNGADIYRRSVKGFSALHIACAYGSLDMAKFLLKNGAETESMDAKGNTPLIYAAYYGNLDLVKFLFDQNANINARSGLGKNILHMAVIKGHKNVVEFLLGKGFSIDDQTRAGHTAFQLACLTGHKEIAEYLLEKKATFDDNSLTASLQLVCSTKMQHMVEYLLKIGAKLDGVLSDGSFCGDQKMPPPLHMAAIAYDTEEIFEYLLEQGANVDILDKDGKSALIKAAVAGSKAKVKLLLGKNAHIDADDKDLALYIFVMGDTDLFKDVSSTLNLAGMVFDESTSFIHWAVVDDNCQMIEYLVTKKNMNVNVSIHPLLDIALKRGNAEVAQCLIDNGAFNDPEKYESRLIATIASQKPSVPILDFLLNNGAGVNDFLTPYGRPVKLLFLAAQTNNCKIIQCLIDHNAFVDEIVENKSPLHIATKFRHIDVIKCLCANGADINHKNDENQSPYEFAIETCSDGDDIDQEIIKYYEEQQLLHSVQKKPSL